MKNNHLYALILINYTFNKKLKINTPIDFKLLDYKKRVADC